MMKNIPIINDNNNTFDPSRNRSFSLRRYVGILFWTSGNEPEMRLAGICYTSNVANCSWARINATLCILENFRGITMNHTYSHIYNNISHTSKWAFTQSAIRRGEKKNVLYSSKRIIQACLKINIHMLFLVCVERQQ